MNKRQAEARLCLSLSNYTLKIIAYFHPTLWFTIPTEYFPTLRTFALYAVIQSLHPTLSFYLLAAVDEGN